MGVSDVSSEAQRIEDVYQSSWTALTRLAFLLVGDIDEAHDIVQSVFATATARWAAIDDPSAYLKRAVVNRANDFHRKEFRKAAAPPLERHGGLAEPNLDGVWKFVQALPPAQRSVVVLRYYADLSLIDTAELLGRRASTVRSDLRRALNNLKRYLT